MRCRVCGSELFEDAIFCGECGSAVEAAPYLPPTAADRRPADTSIVARAVLRTIADTRTARPAPQPGPAPVVEASALPDPGDLAEPVPTWVLAASTGERAVVAGSGLLGRKPVAQPGESFDQLLTLADPTRSVSKTHLEFGVESGELWVLDRFSSNGTTLVAPDGRRTVCEPGRRYRVARGSRIEVGDQHLMVG
jgi:hypothetical protein